MRCFPVHFARFELLQAWCQSETKLPQSVTELEFGWRCYFDNESERSAGGRWSIVEVLFDQESWNRLAGGSHTWIERGNQQPRNVGHGRNPANRVAIHVLPHSLRRVGLNGSRIGSCTAESSCCQRKDERKHDNADERQAPPWY